MRVTETGASLKRYWKHERRENLKGFKILFIVLISVLLCASIGLAQVSSGRITGKVVDQDDNPLPGVTIEATSPNMVGVEATVSDIEGVYRFNGLPPGQYEIRYALVSFKTVRRTEIVLEIEQTLTLNIAMEMGIEEEVTVVAETPLIDLKSTSQGMVLDKESFTSLPKGRNYDSLMDVIAGTDRDEEYTGGTSVDGASGLENMYYIDGMDTTDSLLGQAEQDAVFEFVEEVQIKSSGYQAEFGGSLGGIVNVVTRSGGNTFSGELVAYYSGSALTGKERDTLRLNPYDVTQAEYVNYQDLYGKDKVNRMEVGFGLGGYLVKDKVWFFGSFLPVFRTTERQVEWLEGSVPSGTYKESRSWYNFMGKITAQPFSGLRMALTGINNFSKYKGDLPDRDGQGDSSFAYGDAGFDYPNYTLTLTADWTLNSNLLASVRAGYFRTNITNQQIVVDEPRYVFGMTADETNAIYPDLVAQYPDYIRTAGFENYSRDLGLEAKKKLYIRASGNLDLTYYFNLGGQHAFKAGFQFVRLTDDLDYTYPYEYFQFGWGQDYFIFGAEDVLYKGAYGMYAVSEVGDYGDFGKTVTDRLAFYIQDSWTIKDRLTLNVGVRAEKEEIPTFTEQWQDDPIARDFEFVWGFFDKFAPRIGAIYDVFGDGSTKFFGNYAIYYDVVKLLLSESAYGAMVRRYNYYTLDDPKWWTYGKGNIPGTFVNSIYGYRPSFDATQSDMKPMAQSEISFGVERQLLQDLSVSARVLRKNLLYAIDDLGISTPGGTFWWIANPGYGPTLSETNGGQFPAEYPDTPKAKREYIALNLVIEKRLSNNWMGGASYTLSRLKGNFSGLANTDSGQLYPNEISLYDRWFQSRDRHLNPINGLLATDRPHFLKVYGSYVFDFGLTVGINAMARSGNPINKMVSAPSGYFPDGRATEGRTPFIFTTDFFAAYNLKITDKYRMQLNLNISNLTDAKTARRVREYVNRIRINASDAEKLTGTWNYEDVDYEPDPRYKMEHAFIGPIEARLGFKFIF